MALFCMQSANVSPAPWRVVPAAGLVRSIEIKPMNMAIF
jgi:hypothetical protein